MAVDFVETTFGSVAIKQKDMRAIDTISPTSLRVDHERLLAKYAELQHDYEHADGCARAHAEVEQDADRRRISGRGGAAPDPRVQRRTATRAVLARV